MRFFRDLTLSTFTAGSGRSPLAWIAGIGSALWGVVAGSIALFVQQYGRNPKI